MERSVPSLLRQSLLARHPVASGVVFFGGCAAFLVSDLASRHPSMSVWLACGAGVILGALMGALFALKFGGGGGRTSTLAVVVATAGVLTLNVAGRLASAEVRTIGLLTALGCLTGLAVVLRTVRRPPL